MGAGVIGGLSYNKSDTKVVPVVEEIKTQAAPASAFNPSGFVSLKVIIRFGNGERVEKLVY